MGGGLARQPPASGASDVASAAVDLKVLQWGIDGQARPGSWIGVQVQVSDLGQTTREVLLQLEMPDPDGDKTLYQSTVAVGSEKKLVWLYARLPFSAAQLSEFVVTAHAVAEPTGAQRRAGVARAGELLGRTRFNVPQRLDPHLGLFAIVGRSSAGLRTFTTDAGYQVNYPPMSHERVVLAQLTAPGMPDRWMGLAEFDTIVWTGSGPDFEPSELSEDGAAAIREWVQRGGHLVVVLPTVGQNWTDPRQPLADVMPRVALRRRENVDLNPYRALLTDRDIALPTSGVVQEFESAPDAKPGEATAVLAGPDGKAVVVSRTVGCGAVTLVGFDLARTLEPAVKADVFWNRVLGRRGRLLTDAEVVKSREPNFSGPQHFTNRQARFIDQDVAGLINKTGQAFAGVMLAFVLFACYWVVAGPLGFWVAKRRDASRHAWVGFVVVGVLFTLVAWTGASVLKPGKTEAQHLTVVDHVYGQPVERAKVWLTVLLPRFGQMEVGISDASSLDPKRPAHDVLAPWDAPPSQLVGPASSSFADAQGYGVNARAPGKVLTPSRSTTKTYVGEWLGGPAWKMPLPYTEDGTATGELRLAPDNTPRGWRLDGALKHDLPGTLTDVTVIVIRGQRPVRPSERYVGQLQTEGEFFETRNWKPGELLDIDNDQRQWNPLYRPGTQYSLLRALVGTVSYDEDAQAAWNRRRGGTITLGGGGGQAPPPPASSSAAWERLRAMSLFGVLEPPDAMSTGTQVLMQRADFHRWDLSRWFSRPCVIVLGQMENAPSPVPLTLEGEPMATLGRTVVRWVYPLPESPPRITAN